MYKEGKATIKYTKESFLNADALISRDISVAYVSETAKKNSSILDCTAATGIRGIRYYIETRPKDITFLEINKKAFKSLRKNITLNKVKADMLCTSIQEFANSTDKKFDFIDLDPFGGVTPYIYDLMKVSMDGTHMMITATDAAVLCGADYQACMRLYDARPMHNELCQEVGLRLLTGYVARIAAQFNFGIEVHMSFSYLHYMRVFLELHHGAQNAIDSIKNLGYVYYCNKCLNRNTDKSFLPLSNKCNLCGNPVDAAGKIWLENLSDKGILDRVAKRMSKAYSQEAREFIQKLTFEIDPPLFYSIPKITRKMGVGSVSPNKVMALLAEGGFAVSKTYLDKSGIKTDAGIEKVKNYIKKSR